MYTRVMSLFTSFMHDQYHTSVQWPVEYKYVVTSIGYWSIHGREPATTASYVSTLTNVHKINLLTDPTECFQIKIKINLKTRQNTQVDDRLCITFDLLRKLVTATYHVSTNSFIRVSKFTVTSKSGPTGLMLQRSAVMKLH